MNKQPTKRGRPPITEGESRAEIRARVSKAEHAKYNQLGASEWLLPALKRAKVKGKK